ncbi:MAG: NAD-dependent epimerase/dehydratase family protein, partial [Myxococcales bacterium]|nr:NAD-dependent epimerase/dehydratase family protein [Myxococcales bacterium]
MRVLVTGGAGFLGSHLCDRMIADGHHVVSLDDYSSGRPENLRQLEGNPRFHALRADVRHPIELAATPLDGLDRLYHLACPASPTAYQRDPIGTARTAFQGTL